MFATAAEVRALRPDFAALATLEQYGTIATAPGDDCDFVSRFFAPRVGVPEDPVTGSAHCMLTPYWANRLGKNKLHARQLSARGGELWCELAGDRVKIAGQAVVVFARRDHDLAQPGPTHLESRFFFSSSRIVNCNWASTKSGKL